MAMSEARERVRSRKRTWLLAGVLVLMVAWFAGMLRSPAGQITFGLTVVAVALLASFKTPARREFTRALLLAAAVAVVTVQLSSGAAFRDPRPQPAAKSAFRQAQRLDITDGCPEVARLRAWATCVLGKATAATNKHLSPTTTTTTTPRSR